MRIYKSDNKAEKEKPAENKKASPVKENKDSKTEKPQNGSGGEDSGDKKAE